MYGKQLIELTSRKKPSNWMRQIPAETFHEHLKIMGSPIFFRVNKYQLGQRGRWYCFDLLCLLIIFFLSGCSIGCWESLPFRLWNCLFLPLILSGFVSHIWRSIIEYMYIIILCLLIKLITFIPMKAPFLYLWSLFWNLFYPILI